MGSDRAGRLATGRAKRRDQLLPLLGYLAAVAALVTYALISGDQRFIATGDSYPGTFTSCAEPVGYFTAIFAAAICLGGLVYVVTTARPDPRGVIDPPAFRIHLVLERVSLVWLVASAFMVVVQAATDAGAPALRLV